MRRKEVLLKRMQRLEAKKQKLIARGKASEDAAEVRSINEKIDDINDDIEDVKAELDAIEEELAALKDDEKGDDNGADDNGTGEDRSNVPDGVNVEHRGGNPLAAYGQKNPQAEQRHEEPFSSMEYRQAFKQYVQTGEMIPEDVTSRAAGDKGTTLSTEIGALIPQTVLNELIREVSEVHGQIYSKVRKLNIKGGVKVPISKLSASFKWVGEGKVSDRVKAGEADGYVEFSYNLGEIRISTTLLASVTSLDVFETELTKIMVEAFLKAMDEAILNGTGTNQPLGILKDSRVTNVVEFTAAEFAKWSEWRKKLFAAIPLAKRGKGEFLFTNATLEANLMTMKDNNDRPLFKEATEINVQNDAIAGSFYGRPTQLVEPGAIKDFETAAAGDVVGVFWNPTDYAINTNMEFGMKRYFDDDTNEYVNKAIVIVDGKILDASGCWIIKKK